MDNNILVQNLCKQFEDFSLDNVSFKVPKGRIVGFIGENGAGKSTAINLILNELNKDSRRPRPAPCRSKKSSKEPMPITVS